MEYSTLERRSGVALWRQIADAIRAGLGSGLANADGRLPPEAALAARFGVNRHTVRAAIASLIHEGVLRSEQGRGTFLRRQARFTYPIRQRTRFSHGLRGQAAHRRSRLLDHCEEEASQEIAQALKLAPGHPVIRVELVGEADGAALSRATHWFDTERFAGIEAKIAAAGSVTEALASCGIADYLRQSTVIRASHADAVDTIELQLSPGAIILETFAVNADVEGNPIQYSHTRFAADRMELTVDWTDAEDRS